MQQQAYAEMQRVTGQIDVIQNNVNDLQSRVGKLERKPTGDNVTHQEIESLRASIAELRREMANMRQEIVKDLTARLSAIQKEQAKRMPPPAPEMKPVKSAYTGPCQEYTVISGDTLSLISQAFNTKVETLKSINNLKNNNLRVGQKLLVPKGN